MNNKTAITLSIAGVLSLGAGAAIGTGIVAHGPPTWEGAEKCQGVVAKAKNDCSANGHACGGKAAVDRDPEEWMWVPAGLCDRIAGSKIKGAQ